MPLPILIPALLLLGNILLLVCGVVPLPIFLTILTIILGLAYFIMSSLYWPIFWVKEGRTALEGYVLNLGKEMENLSVTLRLPNNNSVGSSYPKNIPRWKRIPTFRLGLDGVQRSCQNNNLVGEVAITVNIKGDGYTNWSKVVRIQVPPVEERITR